MFRERETRWTAWHFEAIISNSVLAHSVGRRSWPAATHRVFAQSAGYAPTFNSTNLFRGAIALAAHPDDEMMAMNAGSESTINNNREVKRRQRRLVCSQRVRAPHLLEERQLLNLLSSTSWCLI